MPITLTADTSDLLRYRFAVSPIWETLRAVRALVHPEYHAAILPWVRTAARHQDQARSGLFALLMPVSGYTPDFLTPPPVTPTAGIEDELARVRRTPLDRVSTELGRAAAQYTDPPPALQGLLRNPARALDDLTGMIEHWWQRLVAADWNRIRDALDGDIAYRAGRLTRGGIELLVADLHAHVHWDAGRIVVAGHDDDRDLGGLGLLFVPSVFTWPTVSVITDPPWQPTLVYPARGVSTLWTRPSGSAPKALAALLGRTRATVLQALHEPVSTTNLAARLSLSAGTVSAHLTVLHRAGLATAHRVGHQIHYTLSPLGHRLATGREPASGASRPRPSPHGRTDRPFGTPA